MTKFKSRKIIPITLILCLALVVLIYSKPLQTVRAAGNTYYISPTGSDSNSGALNTPWKTFAFAVPKLNPGDTLVLKDGTYDSSNSGYPNIICGTNANNGTSGNPITIKAENERQAFLSGIGTQDTIRIESCSYWIIQGLYAKNSDVPASGTGTVVNAYNSNHLVFRRLLLTNNNRYTNSHLLLLYYTNNSLVEENELYYFHRHGIISSQSDGNIIRRNYVNSRGYTDLQGGYPSGAYSRGDSAVVIYPGTNTIVENNISEGNISVIDIQAEYGPTDMNTFLGNISIGDLYGALFRTRGPDLFRMAKNSQITNFVAINSVYTGAYLRANKNTNCTNCSFLSGSQGFLADVEVGQTGDGAASVYATNALVSGMSSYGFNILDQAAWGLNYTNSFNTAGSYNPPTPNANITNSSIIDPHLGTCKIWIPDNSPMKGAGKNGADIGANILYRYQDGVLTNQPLWNISTGEFPHGAIIAGVNDIAGSSLFDIQNRLNVNTNGCAFPAGYGGGTPPDTTPPSPPTNVKIQ